MAGQTSNLTFGIIKPDAVRGGKTGAIIQRITDKGFRVRGMKLIHMTKPEAEGFYAVHRERPLRNQTGLDLAQSKSVSFHLANANSSCHRCGAMLPGEGEVFCKKCNSFNLNW